MKKVLQKFFGLLVAVIVFFVVSTASAADLLIFHTNDIHGRILPTDEQGKTIGYAETTGAVNFFRAKYPDVLWLDAGDATSGMPYVNVSKGLNMIKLMNAAKVDAMTFGNHEFDYGFDDTKKLIKAAKFPMLAANIVYKDNHKKFLSKQYKIFTMKDGLKVGVFGLATPYTVHSVTPSHVAMLDFLDPVERAKRMVEILRPQCDVIVAITHLGVDEHSEFTSTNLAKQVKGIDVIIDGHSHTTLPNGITIGNTVIAQTGCYDFNLGRVTINYNPETKKIISKRADLLDKTAIKNLNAPPDKNVAALIKEIKTENDKIFGQVIAHNDRQFPGDMQYFRHNESELGDLVADALRERVHSDIAIMNGGGIRTNLPVGDVTKGDIIAMFPFGNVLKEVEIPGKTVREMLEHSVSAYPEPMGGFLQVSGLKFTFDPSKPIGERVGAIYVNNMPLDENKIYTMAAADFLLAGGDGYEMLKGLKVIGQDATFDIIVTDYINKVGTQNVTGGRIIDVQKMNEQGEENKKAA